VSVAELVSRVYRAARDPRLVVLSLATPGVELLPVTALARCLSAEARRTPRGAVAYEMPPGLAALRATLSRRALALGCLLSPDDLIVTGGVTEAITLGLLAVAGRGDTVAVETPAYYGTLQAIEALGLKAIPIPCDPETGMDLDELGRQLERQRIAAVVAVPSFSNPLGSCMPDAAKERLVRMLAARRVPLVEDDVYGDLAFGPSRPRPAKAWDVDGNVIYCGSFTKSLGPGFRLGFAAPGRHLERFEVLKFALNVAVPSITQRALASYLGSGGYDRHLRALRAQLRGNVLRMSAAVAESFPAGTRVSRPQGGCFLWIDLPPGVDALALHARALEAGVSIAPGPIFSPVQSHRSSIRLSCGDPWSERIASAVRLVGRLAASPEPRAGEGGRG
jgi:DNA-binding transcriptional MocR family regulator